MAETSFGVATIHAFRAAQVKSGQVGYSVSPAGKYLPDDRDGDWRKEWAVIGYEDACGAPIFLDTSLAGFPVYTAIPDQGR